LVVCDTIPARKTIDKIKVVSVADLFAVAIRNAYENKSINSLFIRSKMHKKNFAG
jgi:ribose-phosphate pyrophosphokinase